MIQDGDGAGYSVSSAGDINGDGFDDLIVGAPFGDDGGNAAGEAYVVFGKASGFGTTIGGQQVIDLTSLSPADGFIIQGDEAGDQAGCSVSAAGDVNGDGFDDVIIGALNNYDAGNEAGAAYLVFGKMSGLRLGGWHGASGYRSDDPDSRLREFVIWGDAAFDYAGRSVSSAGDVNGDGFDDLLVGATSTSHPDGPGEAFVIYGSTFGGSTTPVVTNGDGDPEILIGGAGRRPALRGRRRRCAPERCWG